MPLDVGRDRQGHHLFIPRHSPITAHPPCGGRSRGGSGGRCSGSGLWGGSVRLHHSETLALSETLVLSRLQKVVRKPEKPLRSAETSAFWGTRGGRLARIVASETQCRAETRCFLGTRSAFAVKGNLRCSSRPSSLLTRPFEPLVPFCLFRLLWNSLAFSCPWQLKSAFS